MRTRAEIVIVGGGIAGASIARHLSALGRTDVVVVEQGALVSGTTSHAPGLIGQLRASASLTRLLGDSVALYRTLSVDGVAGFQPVGSLRLASSPARLAELRRQKAFADRCGLEAHLLTAAETLERVPLLEPNGIEGALYLPTDGSATAPILAGALIREAQALGIDFQPHTRVTAVDAPGGHVRAVETDRGRIETETLVIAAGIWSPVVGRMAGVQIPLTPFQHQYIETPPLAALAAGMIPNVRDPDNLFYFRQREGALLIGGYEKNPRPFRVAIPRSDNPTVQPFDRAHFRVLGDAAARRLPAIAGVAPVREVNGLESFTPDGAFIVGPWRAVQGLWAACGFCAHGVSGAGGVGKHLAQWIVDGRPEIDLSAMAPDRFAHEGLDDDALCRRAAEVYATYYDVTQPDAAH